MILDTRIVSLINDQIGREQFASFCYTAAANWCELAGYTRWFVAFATEPALIDERIGELA